MGHIGRPATSVTSYQATLCNIPEEQRPQLQAAEAWNLAWVELGQDIL
jgi:hypothetical protein